MSQPDVATLALLTAARTAEEQAADYAAATEQALAVGEEALHGLDDMEFGRQFCKLVERADAVGRVIVPVILKIDHFQQDGRTYDHAITPKFLPGLTWESPTVDMLDAIEDRITEIEETEGPANSGDFDDDTIDAILRDYAALGIVRLD